MNGLIVANDTQIITHSQQPLDQNPAAVFIACKPSQHSQRTMKGGLDKIAGMLTDGNLDAFSFPWETLRYQHTAAIQARLIAAYSPATVNNMLSALRGVLKEAWRLGLMTAEDYQRAIDIKNVKGETIPAGREIATGEIASLFRACAADTTPAGIRDAAIIAVLYICGLRRSEVVGLNFEDYESETGRLIIRGKGRKERTTYLEAAHDYLTLWLAVRGEQPGALFCAIRKNGILDCGQMTDQAIYKMLEKRGKAAGLKDFSPHDFRRTFVGDLLEAGADIVTVQKLAGHASPSTTARYDRRPEAAKRNAVKRLHIPRPGAML